MERVTSHILILILMTVNGFAQTNWEKYAGNPVLTGGPPGAWDSTGVIATGTLFDGTSYHMWYSTFDSLGIGYATSPDGINWTKHATNPVLEPGPDGAWDEFEPGGPNVIFKDSNYHMWYNVFDGTNALIGYATSPDGFTWTKHPSNPILSGGPVGTWDEGGVIGPNVIFKDSNFHMWYTGWDGTNTRIGYATSSDGVNWIKYVGNPVVNIGLPDSWHKAGIGSSPVVYNGTTFEMWYTGIDSMLEGTPFPLFTQGIGYATSPDGITWTKFEENPVLTQAPCCDGWDWLSAYIPNVIFDGINYQMWYTGFSFTEEFGLESSIGYATAPKDPITGIADEGVVPEKYELSQNYPNPFNPETVIRYSIPKAEEVSLVVYNLIGEEVAHLIDERKPAGSYTVKWNASIVSSGIYFYRLQAGNFIQTRKMVLLK